MNDVILIDKPVGQTPFQAILQYKHDHPEYADIKMTYAGRLDPMASGLLLILAGEKVHEKDQFLGLDKTYHVDILLGFSTDTYDILGLVTDYVAEAQPCQTEQLNKVLRGFVGKFTQIYPPYSSRPIEGKPLWQHTREGSQPEMPEKDVEIYDISIKSERIISGQDLQQEIMARIAEVSGDFRQDVIVQKWQESIENKDFPVITLQVHCSSGTYMRSLAHQIGEKLGIPALAYHIRRTKIGDFTL